MKLLDNEQVVKQWNYGSVKVGKEKKECNLFITNKRIVEEKTSDLGISRSEVPIDKVQSVSSMHQTASKTMAIVLMVLGALILLVGIIIAIAESEFSLVIPFLFVGIAVLIVGIFRFIKKPLKFNVIIYTPASSCSIATGMNIGAQGRRAGVIKITANIDVVVDMVETISNIILEVQAQNAKANTPVVSEPFSE